ncbi:MAG: class B sortase [Eubacterium sp.]|nr:class B sortase [Eubacterium sp.]
MKLLKALNWILVRMIILLMIVVLLFSSYILWSNYRTYADVGNVYDSLLQLKPDNNSDGKPGFDELKKINPDVCGWITLDGTNVDYPIVQGENNLEYMDKDVYGKFSLAGSIFLDSRNNNDLKDSYSLVYGHHMSNHLMFGDLDLYKDKEFFEINRTATLTSETDITKMTVLAVLQIPDSTEEIFSPLLWGDDLNDLAKYIQDNAMHIWDDAMVELINNPTTTQAVALATCSDGNTGDRTVIILISHRDIESQEKLPQTGDSIFNSPTLWVISIMISLMGLIISVMIIFKKSNRVG